MCRSSPRNSITFALLRARRIGCGVGFEWKTRFFAFVVVVAFFFPFFLSFFFFEIIRCSWRKIGEYSRDKFPYSKFLDIRNAFIDGSLHSLLNSAERTSRVPSVFILAKERGPSQFIPAISCSQPGTAEFADSSSCNLNYISSSETSIFLDSDQHVPNSLSQMIYLFDIRIFVSRVARNYTPLRFVDDSFLWKRKKKK